MKHFSFFALLNRMKYIHRWGLMRNHFKENLSEHSLEVGYIAHGLISIHNNLHPQSPLSCEKAVMFAIYHDCSEIITGDLPTPVKYYNDQIKTAYKALEADSNRVLLSKLPAYMHKDFQPYFSIEEAYEKYIKAADKISALIKCSDEKKMGNSEFSTAYTTILGYLKDMNMEENEIFLKEFFPAYNLTLDEL